MTNNSCTTIQDYRIPAGIVSVVVRGEGVTAMHGRLDEDNVCKLQVG